MYFQNFSHFLEKEKEKTEKDKHFTSEPLKEILIKPSNGVPVALFMWVTNSALNPLENVLFMRELHPIPSSSYSRAEDGGGNGRWRPDEACRRWRRATRALMSPCTSEGLLGSA
jgi:hypothetical protein